MLSAMPAMMTSVIAGVSAMTFSMSAFMRMFMASVSSVRVIFVRGVGVSMSLMFQMQFVLMMRSFMVYFDQQVTGIVIGIVMFTFSMLFLLMLFLFVPFSSGMLSIFLFPMSFLRRMLFFVHVPLRVGRFFFRMDIGGVRFRRLLRGYHTCDLISNDNRRFLCH